MLNKDQRGKITVMEFNSIVGNAQLKVVSELFSVFKKTSYREMRMQLANNYGNDAFIQKQLIEFYVTSKEININGGKAQLPPDVLYVESVFDSDNEYEKVELKTFNSLSRTKRMRPSQCLPVFTLNNNEIRISSNKTSVELDYIRKTKTPKYTFQILQGIEMFNPSASDFQDIDIPEALFTQLLTEVLSMAGLNVREQEVEAFANGLKQEEMYNNQ
ncbi:hypothetical protein [Elizabethkingia anophelis]|uniref:hypothetical protein n=2 Tax=Elizabethkingia anophelis TaxID=1117645 RepID=UPI0024055FB4|nr:hypothetical protein [Elizabethkingia anophelis]